MQFRDINYLYRTRWQLHLSSNTPSSDVAAELVCIGAAITSGKERAAKIDDCDRFSCRENKITKIVRNGTIYDSPSERIIVDFLYNVIQL